MSLEFYECQTCKNMITHLKKSPINVVCCGREMTKIVPNTQEAATEKHIPEVTITKNTVEVVVGSVVHPMTEEHYIDWIALETENNKTQIVHLSKTGEPKCVFNLSDNDKAKTVYAFCNLHGLWKQDL